MPLPTTSQPSPSSPKPALEARINAIRDLLTEIQISVDNRQHLIELAAANPKFHIDYAHNQEWKQWALNQSRIFHIVKEQVEGIGNDATVKKVMDWEGKVEKLRQGTLNQVDKSDAENEWADFEEDPKGVMTSGWSWEGAAGKGPGVDEEPVCPRDADKVNPFEDAGQYSHLSTGRMQGD